MNASRIRGFLMQVPRPATVRVTGDGEPELLKPGRSFARTAETIIALGPELVECLDAEGKVLRAVRLADADAQRSDAAPIPDGIKQDPQALMLTHFANLLHRAYEHSTETAFLRLVELTERMNDRSDAIEARLERAESTNRRMLQQQVDDAFERAEEMAAAAQQGGAGGEDLVRNLAGAFLGGMHQSPRPRAPHGPNGANGSSNGKA